MYFVCNVFKLLRRNNIIYHVVNNNKESVFIANISLERPIILSNEDVKIIENTHPTKKFYDLLEKKSSDRISNKDQVPNWMRKK